MAQVQEEHKDDASTGPPAGLIGRSLATLSAAWTQRALVQTALVTTARFYTIGCGHEAWDLRTALFIGIARAVSEESKKRQDPNAVLDPAKATQSARKRLVTLEMKNPKFGACVEIKIPVKPKRGLGGILELLDQEEEVGREIPAEWQLHKDVKGKANERVLLYFHGGGYTRRSPMGLLNPRTHRPISLHLSQELGCRVLSVDYRLAPETVFPGALYDAVTSYLYLTEELKVSPSNVLIGGDSAGAGLCLSLMLYLRDTKMNQVAGAILLSPFCDITHSLHSWESNGVGPSIPAHVLGLGETNHSTFIQHLDYLSVPVDPSPLNPAKLYAPSNALHPYVTSVLADHQNLPPLLLQAGGAETLRDEVTLLAHRADRAGVDVTHEIYDSGVHVTHLLFESELARVCRIQVGVWAKKVQGPEKLKTRSEGWSEVDALFGSEWKRLEGNATDGGANKSGGAEKKATPQPAYIFEPVVQEAPQIHLRQNANEEVAKAVEEDAEYKPRKGLTTIFVPKRNPKAGLVGQVRGVLHL
ncbi:BZ3500_MvSof-1268-A1-R1_Chr10-1g02574 [Microbotryum saponariae]|uniref:BZ3500_MvSof-1268-A1-R1_Chr10-1g02574 protein n=1 Tax=Microbotryum saponariae TaxID=289078 RepID=A0A2X0L8F7_9BASI|nr:BZ3500_MvSof-1268-A1-R1_Chr10-1g02574 [Microbotryum saponariae]SDA06063.1 BZ3501_MvSof-1269-A2-R1_Chr10-1g02175 [Microbotryum saponariae]